MYFFHILAKKGQKSGGRHGFGLRRDFDEFSVLARLANKFFEIQKFLLPQVTPTLWPIDA